MRRIIESRPWMAVSKWAFRRRRMTASIAAPSGSKGEPGIRAALPRAGERTHMDVRAGRRSTDGCLPFLRRPAWREKRSGVEPTGRWRDRHAGANGFGCFCRNKSSPLAWRRAEKDRDVVASTAEVAVARRRAPTTVARAGGKDMDVDQQSHWVPACAGMTSDERYRRIPPALPRADALPLPPNRKGESRSKSLGSRLAPG